MNQPAVVWSTDVMRREPGIKAPDGFVVTSAAYRRFVESARLSEVIAHEIRRYRAGADLVAVGAAIRTAFAVAKLAREVEAEILAAYERLGGDGTAVAVRSGTAGLQDASLAGHQETFLNVIDSRGLLAACKRCFGVLFADRAISYREENGLDHLAVTMPVSVQRMGRSAVSDLVDAEPGGTRQVPTVQARPETVHASKGVRRTWLVTRVDGPIAGAVVGIGGRA